MSARACSPAGLCRSASGRKIALYFTGRQHAGENLADVLKQRAPIWSAPIQMCDALSRNTPKLSPGVEILLANCLAHGRRQFVEVAQNFPGTVPVCARIAGQCLCQRCRRTRAEALRSGPSAVSSAAEWSCDGELHGWLEAQLAEKKTEPNSGLGKAITYLLRHWKGLTAFLREAGAPLDNNLCERALKRAVLHRKNALFYKTLHGAEVGDVFMSLIHTCQLCGANSFEYLTELQRHARELAANPAEWMPWNYRETLAHAPPPGNIMSSCLAEKDSLRPDRTTLKWPPNGPLQKPKSDRFLASHGNRRKCFAPACMPAFPRTISRLCPCRVAPCGNMLPGAAGRSPCKSVKWAPEQRKRQAREKLLEAARRREIDVVLVGDWIAGADP